MKVRENDAHGREKSWESQGKKFQDFAMNLLLKQRLRDNMSYKKSESAVYSYICRKVIEKEIYTLYNRKCNV